MENQRNTITKPGYHQASLNSWVRSLTRKASCGAAPSASGYFCRRRGTWECFWHPLAHTASRRGTGLLLHLPTPLCKFPVNGNLSMSVPPEVCASVLQEQDSMLSSIQPLTVTNTINYSGQVLSCPSALILLSLQGFRFNLCVLSNLKNNKLLSISKMPPPSIMRRDIIVLHNHKEKPSGLGWGWNVCCRPALALAACMILKAVHSWRPEQWCAQQHQDLPGGQGPTASSPEFLPCPRKWSSKTEQGC